MRVLCINAARARLELDQEYEVLEVYASPGREVHLRVVATDGTPALFDTSLFMTIDGSLRADWEARVDEGGALHVGPAEWMERGFWEAFFDREPPAVATYERVLRSS